MIRIAEYERATTAFVGDAMWALAKAQHPLLGEIREERREEGPLSSSITDKDGATVELAPAQAGAKTVWDWKDILELNLASLYTGLYKAGGDLGETTIKGLLGTLTTVTTSTGNVVDAKGMRTGEAVAEALEKMEIDFDENGEPRMPTMFVSPELAEKLRTSPAYDEDAKAIAAVIARKREEYFASRRSRRIP